MDIQIEPGQYVVGVSGGVDSVVLLDLLRNIEGVKLLVAHYDHGIREDSAWDRRFVQDLAVKYDLPFLYREGNLGPAASEAEAREARYDFLRKAAEDIEARAIITAHHQDDVLETAILNILRGTGRRGLSSLQSNQEIVRPLLGHSKESITKYAQANGLKWREDPSNHDTKYQRNYIRQNILPQFGPTEKQRLLELLNNAKQNNQAVDIELDSLLQSQGQTINRVWFNRLPHSVAREMMATWLRDNGVRGYDKNMLERLVAVAKTAQPGKLFPVAKGTRLVVNKQDLALQHAER